MARTKIALLFVLLLGVTYAQNNSKKRVFKGEITDSTASEIFSNKVKLNPVYGTEDIYIRTDSSTVLDLAELGDKNNYTTFHPAHSEKKRFICERVHF